MKSTTNPKKKNKKNNSSPKTKLLLHTCCANCALQFINSLNLVNKPDSRKYEVTLYFDNDNIHPRTEYLARLEATRYIAQEHQLKLVVADWTPKKWYSAISKDNTKLLPNRCNKCWNYRLQQTVNYAQQNGFTTFSTTLLTSHYQNYDQINKIALSLQNPNLSFLATPRNTPEVPTKGFYKQNYCGCMYSLVERMEQKWNS